MGAGGALPTARRRCTLALLWVVWGCGIVGVPTAHSADWPTWRYDANRSAASPAQLPSPLHLQWKREMPPPRPAFREDPRLCFDLSYEPVTMGKTLFVPSMVTDSVTALDTSTGEERWTFYAEGPVRFAPVAWRDKIYFTSDDGYLYCLTAGDGRLVWRFGGLPPDRTGPRLLGNGRLISRWPARGGPVIADGTAYFASGVWPFEGVHIFAVDAEKGNLVWAAEGSRLLRDGLLDHSTRRDGGISPQGYLAVLGDKLVVPSGRALPGFFDRKSGEMEPYTTGWGGRVALAKGCWYACGIGDRLFQSGDLYSLAPVSPPAAVSGKPDDTIPVADFASQINVPLETVERWIKERPLATVEQNGERFIRVRTSPPITYLSWWIEPRRRGEDYVLANRPRLQIDPANDKELGAYREPILAPEAVYYSCPVNAVRKPASPMPANLSYREIVACDLTSAGRWEVTYQGDCDGTPGRPALWKTMSFNPLWRLPSDLKVHVKAGDRLYGGRPGLVAAVDIPKAGGKPRVSWSAEIEGRPFRMLAADDRLFVVTEEGALYCFGAEQVQPKTYAATVADLPSTDDGWAGRAGEILRRTNASEGYCVALGLGSGRLIEELARQSKLCIIALEPDPAKADAARRRFGEMGWYGTRIQVLTGDLRSVKMPPYLASLTVSEDLSKAQFEEGRAFVERLFTLARPYGGTAYLPLPPQDHATFLEWVKASALARGEVKREDDFTVLMRSGPLPGASDWTHPSGSAGNTFASSDEAAKPPFGVLWFGSDLESVMGPSASPPLVADGRMFVLAGKELDAMDIYTGRRLWRVPLAAPGRLVAALDGVYVASGSACLRLDPATGSKTGAINVPDGPPGAKKPSWQEVRVWGDYLLGSAGKDLLCMDRRNGRLLWRRPSRRDAFGFALGAGKAFCVDYWLPARDRRGEARPEEGAILALGLTDGKTLWEVAVKTPPPESDPKKKFPPPLKPQLTYCEHNDVLLFTRNRSTVAAYRGEKGDILWTGDLLCADPPSAYTSHQLPILLADLLVTHGGRACDPQTGRALEKRFWKGMNTNEGTRGCGRALGSPRLITVRDGFASFIDLATDRHTFLRGIRSGCVNALIPADGLLNAPNYARHCSCNYPVFVSFALAPMPDAPGWSPEFAESTRDG